jgi:sirohydrochlorin ferrochelatase
VTDALLLVAHGSRDPRAGQAIDALADRVRAARPGLAVGVATLELRGRRVPEVASELLGRPARRPAGGGVRRVAVVPLLLTNAYHGSVDLPEVLAGARRAVPDTELVAGDVLGPDDRLLDALDERIPAGASFDGIVLAVAGTRDRAAARGIEAVAAGYGTRHGVPCLPAHASAGAGAVAAAASALRARGADRILVASYFLAPGLLHDRIAGASGPLTVTDPFADTGSVASLVLARYERALDRRPVLAA